MILIVWIAIPPSRGESLISKGINFGGFLPSTLLNKSNFLNFFSFTSLRVCRDGVAEPKKTGIFSIWALFIAKSLPENLKPSACLYDWSCSSSIMIAPKFFNGIKTDDLVPITILIPPNLDRSQTFNLWFGVCLEWYTPISPLKRSLNLFSNCGIRLISGTRIKIDLFWRINFSASWRYISVLPDPVTPYINEGLNFSTLLSLDRLMFCSFVNFNFLSSSFNLYSVLSSRSIMILSFCFLKSVGMKEKNTSPIGWW